MEFVPSSFADLLRQMYAEARANDAIFGMPRRKWYMPDGTDLSVRFHDQIAGNPCGPAAGPHTQLAQNLLLSYAAGARMLEFKTVQINDELTIPRPCIDMATIGYNVEWSQELKIEQSIEQYVAGMMLIAIFRNDPFLAREQLSGKHGDVIFDLSVGYGLDGIRSERMKLFFDAMRDASHIIEAFRESIPSEYLAARELEYPSRISSTITLSTFHGCPAEEIEKICEHLLAEQSLNVIVKMNPPTLGKEHLEHLLHDVMGYHGIRVNPSAYESVQSLEDSVQMVQRLTAFAARCNRGFGCKFSNTLEVMNDARVFSAENKTQYLSGPPLHVITMTLTDLFRQKIGAQVPISFSAGIDAKNFADAVACGFVPVTTCTDLLKPGGYGRLPGYLTSLSAAMRAVDALNIDQFILKRAGLDDRLEAELHNTAALAEKARNEPRYRAAANSKPPKRVESELETFDCLTCDKCIPVCPNAANFVYHTPPTDFEFHDWIIQPDGSWSTDSTIRRFEVEESCQIANFTDFCNACGNCDTFCPEYGGPFIRKPQFFGSMETWRETKQDGFAVSVEGETAQIVARIKGKQYSLRRHESHYEFTDESTRLTCGEAMEHPDSIVLTSPLSAPHRIDRGILFTLKILFAAMTDPAHFTPIRARVLRL